MKLPVTLPLAFVTLAAWFIPGGAGLLQFDRLAIAHGEFWRLLTGHFAHWTFEQLFWNLTPFVCLGVACERRDRRGFLLTLALSAMLIPVLVYFHLPSLRFYRGLSGLDSALFTLLGAHLLKEKILDRHWPAAASIILLWAAFLGKVAFEHFSGATLFVSGAGAMAPVALAHLAGASAGIAGWGLSRLVLINTPPQLSPSPPPASFNHQMTINN